MAVRNTNNTAIAAALSNWHMSHSLAKFSFNDRYSNHFVMALKIYHFVFFDKEKLKLL